MAWDPSVPRPRIPKWALGPRSARWWLSVHGSAAEKTEGEERNYVADLHLGPSCAALTGDNAMAQGRGAYASRRCQGAIMLS